MLALSEASTSVLVAAFSVLIALGTVVWQAVSERERQRREHEFTERQRKMSEELQNLMTVRRLRSPVLSASVQLRSRISNILDAGFLEQYGNAHQRYIVESTAFAVCEVFGWAEALRRDRDYYILVDEDGIHELETGLAAMGRAFSTDTIRTEGGGCASMMIWRMQQRAMGEIMLGPAAPHNGVIGYTTFVAALRNGDWDDWLRPLCNDIEAAVEDPSQISPRLAAVAAAIDEMMVRVARDAVA